MGYFATHRPTSIVVFRALQLGDLLCTMPTFRALRAAAPTTHIVYVGLPGMADFAARYPRWIDEFVACPGIPAFPEQAADFAGTERFVERMRERRFSLALQLQGDGTVINALMRRFEAGTLAGFCLPGDVEADDSAHFVPWDAHASEVRRGLDLLARLGVDARVTNDVSIDLPVRPGERAAWRALRDAHGLARTPFVCVHVGARWPSRRWPVERFAAVAGELARRGSRIVLTGGEDERSLVAALAARLAGICEPVDLAGRTSLGVLAALFEDARLVLCNDTGASHVAAATRTASVVVASGSDVERWAPLDTALHRVLAWQVPCRPCAYTVCPIDHPCATGTTVAAVLAAVSAHDGVPLRDVA